MPDRIRLITPQNKSVTSSLALTAKWVRTYEELTKDDFDETGVLTHVVTCEEDGFALQLDRDPNSTPEGYTPGADCVPLMTAAKAPCRRSCSLSRRRRGKASKTGGSKLFSSQWMEEAPSRGF